MSAHSCPAIWVAVTELKVANEAGEEYLSCPTYCQRKPTEGATLTDVLSGMWSARAGDTAYGGPAPASLHEREYVNS